MAAEPKPSAPPLPFSPDPTLAWFRAHFAELQQYKGKQVAIDPVRGVVAVGDTGREVCAKLAAAGIPPESDVCIYPIL